MPGLIIATAGGALSIGGTPAPGQTLTAVLAAGYSVTGVQWMRANADGSNAVDIAGQTAMTYVVQPTDARILVRAIGLTYTSGGVTVIVPTQPPASVLIDALLVDGELLLIDGEYLLVT